MRWIKLLVPKHQREIMRMTRICNYTGEVRNILDVLGVIIWCYNTPAMLIISWNAAFYFSHTLLCCQNCIPGKQMCVNQLPLDRCLVWVKKTFWGGMKIALFRWPLSGNSRCLAGNHSPAVAGGPSCQSPSPPHPWWRGLHWWYCFDWAPATRHTGLPYMAGTCHRPSVAGQRSWKTKRAEGGGA